jgi:iron complex outermembrane receptor protein
MKKSYRRALLLSTALNLVVGAPILAKAADATQTSGVQQIEQIVVTAERREERLQNVPISISVFTQQQLSNHNVVNSEDLAAYTPSLSANNNYGSENSSFAIRGFVQEDGTAPSVGVYFADVVEPRGASNGVTTGDGAGPGDFFDLQNVQVLKGPQGTLFGRNTTGGSVLLVPNMPTSDFGGYIEGSVGNLDMRGGQGVINIPINDHIRLRVGVDHESRDGYLKNTSGIGPRDFDDVNYTSVRATLDIDVTSNIENTLIASYTNSDTHGSVQKMIACDPSYGLGLLIAGFGGNYACQQMANQGKNFYDIQQSMTNPSSKLQTWRLVDTTTWNVNDNLTIKNIASFAELKDDLNNPLFGTNFTTGSLPAFPPFFPGLKSYSFDFSVVSPVPGGDSAHQNTYTEELQFQGHSSGDRLLWQAGFYMEGSGPIGFAGSQSPVFAACTNSATFQCYDPVGYQVFLATGTASPVGTVNYTAGQTTYQDYAGYAQATYKLTDEFKITGGIRYTEDREVNDSTRITNNLGYPNSTGIPAVALPPSHTGSCTYFLSSPSCVIDQKEKSSAPTWLVDLDYTPDDTTLAYAKYTRGYRAGVIAPNIFPPLSIVGPEKDDTYEAGLKKTFDGWLPATLDMAGFYNNVSNQQLQIGFNPNPTYLCGDPNNQGCHAPVSPTASPVNVGQSKIWGFELDSSVSPFDGLTLTLGYAYLNTRIEKVTALVLPPSNPYVSAGSPAVGDPLALSPKNKVTFNASYVLPVNPDLGNITVGATFTHTDKQLTNYNDRTDPGFAGLDFIGVTNLLGLNLNWQHVLNHPFDVSVFATNVTGDKYYTFIPGLIGGTGFETATVGAPAMYGVRLRYDFGEN